MNEVIKRSRTKIASAWRAIDQLADDADQLMAREAEFAGLRRLLRDHANALKAGEPLIEPFPDEREAKLDAHDEKLLQSCREAIDLLDPEANYEDGDREGDLRRDVISVRLAMPCGGFPNGAPGDPEVFVTVMLEHVCAIEGLSFLALDAACRQITTAQKFLPTISEIVAAIEEQQEIWDRRYEVTWHIARRSRQIAADIAALRPAWEAAAAVRDEQAARRNLNYAIGRRSKAAADAVAAQQHAAQAAQEVAAKMAWLQQSEARLSEAAQALTDAVERLASSKPVDDA
jgi:hypothetical protein